VGGQVVPQRNNHKHHFESEDSEPEIRRELVLSQQVAARLLVSDEHLRLEKALLQIVKQHHKHQALRQLDRIVFFGGFPHELVGRVQRKSQEDHNQNLAVLQNQRNLD
jgi:hypothetical protein